MPIAEVVVSDLANLSADAIVEAWDAATGLGAKSEMTVSLTKATQGGRCYAARAHLYLPSLWSAPKVQQLQEGLAAALSDRLGVPPADIQVITLVVPSGAVVEDGQTLHWSHGD